MFEPASLKVIVFPNTTQLPLHVGAEKGYFATEGLNVNITVTPTSNYQMTSLVAGDYQIAIGAFDNVIAYQEDQSGEELAREPDLFAFMGVAQMNLQLVVQPDIKSYGDLKGRTLAVDAPTNGFVLVLQKMLELGGLAPDDYELIAVGTKRWTTMLAGEHAGALMTDNYMVELSSSLHVLDNSLDVFDAYQSAVGTACRSWAGTHRAQLIAFIRAYIASLDWIFDANNRDEAAEILAHHRDGMALDAAARSVAQLVAEREGLMEKAVLPRPAAQTVLELRNQLGRPKKELTDLDKYIDLSYYYAALGTG